VRFVCVDGGREGKRGSWDSGFPKIRKVMPQINSLSGNSSSIPKATTAADDGGRRSYLLSLSIYHLPTPSPIIHPSSHQSIKFTNHKSQIHKSQHPPLQSRRTKRGGPGHGKISYG